MAPAGSFWRGRARSMPIRRWQIWNEPNFRLFWRHALRRAQLRSAARSAARAIRGPTPRPVVLARVAPVDGGFYPWVFLRRLYRSGGQEIFDLVRSTPTRSLGRAEQSGALASSWPRPVMAKRHCSSARSGRFLRTFPSPSSRACRTGRTSWPSTCCSAVGSWQASMVHLARPVVPTPLPFASRPARARARRSRLVALGRGRRASASLARGCASLRPCRRDGRARARGSAERVLRDGRRA